MDGQQERKVLGIIDGGGDAFPDMVTVRDFAGRWLDHKSGTTRPNTVARYRTLLRRYVLPVIGSMPVAKVKPAHVQRVLDTAADKVIDAKTGRKPSRRTIHHVRSVMTGLFQSAVRWEITSSNPVSVIDPVTVPRADLQVPSAEQVLDLFDQASGTVWSVPLALVDLDRDAEIRNSRPVMV